tara:strand:- start:188 stop:523 length:336 start_codon:yes stop_codon:yes gene_type:complete
MVADLNLCRADGSGVDNTRTSNNAQEEEKELVIVTWRDILSCSGWEKQEDVDCPELKTVGWLVSEDTDTIKIASTLDPTDSIGEARGEVLPVPYGITAFPKGCVINVKHLT